MLFKIKTYSHTVEHTCSYCPWEVEVKESGVQGHLQLLCGVEANLGCKGTCLKKLKTNLQQAHGRDNKTALPRDLPSSSSTKTAAVFSL